MKAHILILLIFFNSVATAQTVLDSTMNFNYEEVQLKDIFEDLNSRGFQVFYPDTSLNSITVNFQGKGVSLDHMLEAVLPYGYQRQVWLDNIIIARSFYITKHLPDFDIPKPQKREEENRSASLLSTNITSVLPELKVGNSTQRSHQRQLTVRLQVISDEDEKPIVGATVYFPKLEEGFITRKNGVAIIKLAPGKHKAIAKYVGYQSKTFIVDLYSEGSATLILLPKSYDLQGVEILGDKQMDMMRKDPGIEKFSLKEVKTIPTLVGEPDFIKVSTTLPGITTIGDGAAGVNVRGGGYDQNAFYLNGIPIYNTSHMFGFFPAFNSNIISNLTVYKGYMPPDFGGKLSSVFNLETKKGNKKKTGFRGSVSPLAANIVVDGPIVKNRLSYIVSARSSYSDWVLRNINDTIINRSSGKFNDFTAGLDYSDDKNHLALFGYHSHDYFLNYATSSYQYSNDGVSLQMGRKFSNYLYGSVIAYGAAYTFNSNEFRESSSAFSMNYKIRQFGFKAKLSQKIGDKHNMDYGIDVNNHLLNRGTVEPYNLESMHKSIYYGEENGMEGALFLHDNFKVTQWLSLDLGVRMAAYASLGPDTVFLYTKGLPRQQKYIQDSIIYNKGDVLSSDFFPNYRFSAQITTDLNGTVKISANKTNQSLFLLNTSPALSPTSQWKLADYYLKPAVSSSFSLGVFRKIPAVGLSYSVEGFYKHTNNYTEFIDGADFLNNPIVETATLQGIMNSYGIEFLAKTKMEKIDGWISYTYSRSFVKVDGEEPWEKINNGEAYPSNYDIPHSFNAVVNYKLKKRLILSSVITYQSGRPSTFPIATYELKGASYIDYSKRNAYRIPNYFRWDMSVTIEGSLKKNKIMHSSLIISVYNLTGRDNPYSVFFTSTKGYIYGFQYAVIGVPIFSATWLFKFGNYGTR